MEHSLGWRSDEPEAQPSVVVARSVSTLSLTIRYRAADASNNTQQRKFNNWVKAVQISKAAQYWQRGVKQKSWILAAAKEVIWLNGDQSKPISMSESVSMKRN